jgi:uncharacterized membrane protein
MEARQNIQLILALVLVSISIILPVWYIITVGITADNTLVTTMITAAWALSIAGAGAAFSLFGLGRKVQN